MDGMWTIPGLAAHLRVPREWFYNRIRSGFLRAPDVMRKPPYGNYLIRDDAVLLARLRVEAERSRRHRNDIATGSLPPTRVATLEPPEAGQAREAALCQDIENKSPRTGWQD
jgi:hypothetical protein